MKYFITSKQHDVVENEDTVILSGFDRLGEFLEAKNEYSLDTEANGLDAYKNQVLLVGIGDRYNQFNIDNNSTPIPDGITSLLINKTALGHNLKYDYQMLKLSCGIELNKFYDTMLTDERLYQNGGYSMALEDLIYRHLKIIPKKDRTVQKEFINADKDTFRFSNKHINYLSEDLVHLPDIKDIQLKLIQQWNLTFLLEEIEFPLLKVLAEAELYGSCLDIEKVRSLVKKNTKLNFEQQIIIDNEVKRLRDLLPEDEQAKLRNGKIDRQRIEKKPTIQLGMTFDDISEDKKIKEEATKAVINYGSTDQILKLCAQLKIEVPTERGKSDIPMLGDKGKVIPRPKGDNWTTAEKVVVQFIAENPLAKSKDFFEKIIDYRETKTALERYGEKFIQSINPITGKIHTLFRQATAVNGRLQSGGGKTQPDRFNCQNVPAQKNYRELFHAPDGWLRLTLDLTGAEVTILADKAGDTKLFDLTMNHDIHGYMATAGWKDILRSRGDAKYVDFEISRKVNKELRATGKNNTFASIYGVKAKKAGKTIGVSAKEGQMYINAIKREIPLTFKYVESNVEKAMGRYDYDGVQLSYGQGYLVFNERTNARIWFPPVINNIKFKQALTFREISDIDGQARNTPISGTQADMLKECMVRIYNHFRLIKIPIHLVFQVHDELVFDFREEDKDWLPETVKQIVVDTCNLYLTSGKIKMGASMEYAKHWLKD